MKDGAPLDEMQDEVRDKIAAASLRLANASDWNCAGAQADLRRLVALCWPFVDYFSRTKFIAFQDEFALYSPPPGIDPIDREELELMTILKNWPKVIEGLSGQDRTFALDVQKRRSWKKWKPSPKQMNWIRRLHDDWRKWQDVDGEVMD